MRASGCLRNNQVRVDWLNYHHTPSIPDLIAFQQCFPESAVSTPVSDDVPAPAVDGLLSIASPIVGYALHFYKEKYYVFCISWS